MNFQSVIFLCLFLPSALLAHWLSRRRAGAQNLVLALTGALFFWSWTPHLLPLFLLTLAVNFGSALALDRQGTGGAPGAGEGTAVAGQGSTAPDPAHAAAAATRRRARAILAAAVTYNLLQLFAFKYLGFATRSASGFLGALGISATLSLPALAVPVGIGFWTLQLVGYLIDVFHGRIRACRSPLAFAAFGSFFPQLLAGPIARSDLLDQLAAPRAAKLEQIQTGAHRFFRGFVLRFLIAGSLGEGLVDPIFTGAGQMSPALHWLALAAYALQVFSDFAGYSEMAIGCALLFGVKLRENFDFPFLAGNLMELWKRWHMTLTNWLFDYIYSPLMTGSGRLRGRFDLGFLLTFLVSGLWHGAAWTFVLWGALQGLGLAVHRRFDEAYRGLCRRDRVWVARRKTRSYRGAAWIVTQGFFMLSLIPFRSSSMNQAGAYALGLFRGGGASLPVLGLLKTGNLFFCVALLVAWHALRGRTLAVPAPARGLAYGLLIVYMAIFMPLATGTFIYAQF